MPPMPTSTTVTVGGRSGRRASCWATAMPKPSSPRSTLPTPTISTRRPSPGFMCCLAVAINSTSPAWLSQSYRLDIERELDHSVANRHWYHLQATGSSIQALAGAYVVDTVMPGAEEGVPLQLAYIKRQDRAGTGVAIRVDLAVQVTEQDTHPF